MSQASAIADTADQHPPLVRGGIVAKVFYIFAFLALLSLGISIGGKYFGHQIAKGGHTDSAALREIVIGNNVIVAPDNAIRFPDARHDGVASRLDLYLRWPDLNGYSEPVRDDFNHAGGSKKIIFLTFEEQSMSRDMSGRFAPIYSELIDKPGRAGPGGLTMFNFSAKSGYLEEMLAVSPNQDDELFVARCLTGKPSEASLAPCERDIQIGDNLSLTFRFPAELLPDWRKLEAAMRGRAVSMLKTEQH